MTIVSTHSRVTLTPWMVDAALPQVCHALDSNYMRPRLEPLLARRSIDDATIRSLSAAVVRYKPGRRCLIRYDIAHGSKRRPHATTLLGKIRARSLDRRTYNLCSELWQGNFGRGSRDAAQVPEPLVALPELNMWLQQYIEAQSLVEQLDGLSATAACRTAAVALQKLHAHGPRTARQHGIADELAILSSRLLPVADTTTGYQLRLLNIAEACSTLLSGLPDSPTTPIHRDFYPDQILIRAQASWLLDLDLYAMGDPALDVGNFIAHLQELSLRRVGHCGAYSGLEKVFLEAYCTAAGRDLSQSTSAYITASLARHIAISREFPDRSHTTDGLIRLCEQRLGLALPETRDIAAAR